MNYGCGPGMPWSYGNQNFASAGFGGYGAFPSAGAYGGYGTFPSTGPYGGYGAFPYAGGYGGYGASPFAGGYGGYGTLPYAGGYGFGAATDEEICYFVEQSLDNDPTIPAHVDISVDVNDGVVTLTGTVPNKRIKHAAGDDAWWLPQVLDVHNEINVVSRKERVGTGEKGTGTLAGRPSRGAGR